MPLQDITNMVTKSNLEPENSLLSGQEIMFFTSPNRTTTTATTTSPPPDPSTSFIFSHPMPSSPRQLFPQRRIFRSTSYDSRSIAFRRRRSLPSSSSRQRSSESSFSFVDQNMFSGISENEESELDSVFDKRNSESDAVNCQCPSPSSSSDEESELFVDFPPGELSDADTPIIKKNRKRLSAPSSTEQSKLFKKLHPISKNQLLDLVCDVSKISLNTGFIKEREKSLNSNLVIRLQTLLRNIHRALPDRVFGQTRDAVSFKRVEVHLLLFKQELLRQCHRMYEQAQWKDLAEYIMRSCEFVHHLPKWENTSHNLHKEQLFRVMASYIRKAKKLANFTQSFKLDLKEKLSKNSHGHQSLVKLCQELP